MGCSFDFYPMKMLWTINFIRSFTGCTTFFIWFSDYVWAWFLLSIAVAWQMPFGIPKRLKQHINLTFILLSHSKVPWFSGVAYIAIQNSMYCIDPVWNWLVGASIHWTGLLDSQKVYFSIHYRWLAIWSLPELTVTYML